MTELLTATLGRIHPIFSTLHGIPLLAFVLVVLLTASYFGFYLIQGTRVGFQLWRAIRQISVLKREKAQVDPKAVASILRRQPFRHLWEEYADTLHELRKAGNATQQLVETRATVPAEMYFTREVLVDNRLWDDFVRHLPGVLTGLGIIGTFAGLLTGLRDFDPSSPTKAVAALTPLLGAVSNAFTASASAITCAMVVVFTSRFVLTFFYRKVEQLNHAIDSLYSTGAGEEYLSRLVQSSEKAEAHAAQLKQALVEDLTTLMTNLVEKQIVAQQQVNAKLGSDINSAIVQSLADPMNRITAAIEATNKGNGQAVSGMLESLLTGFMSKLEETFGGQMRGIQDHMTSSMAAMDAVQKSLQGLIENIGRSSESATQNLRSTLEDAMNQAAMSQQAMTEQMRSFIQEFKNLAAQEQQKSHGAMMETMEGVLGHLNTAIQSLEATRNAAVAQEQERNVALSERTQGLVGGLSGQVDDLLKLVQEQSTATRANLDAISRVTTSAIDGMNSGAREIGAAASRFESAGGAVSGVLERAAGISEQLVTSATTLRAASDAVNQGFRLYDTVRQTVETHVTALNGIIETTRREAGLSQSMIKDLERIVGQFKTAETQSREYLDGVSDTLSKAFQSFGTSLTSTIKETIGTTDKHLSTGVQHLNGVVQELSTALIRMRKN